MSHKIFRAVFCFVLVIAQFATGITPALAAPPANDNIADAEPITTLPFSATVDNSEATTEPGELVLCSTFSFRSVWYSFSPSENMALRVNLSGPSAGFVDIFLASGPGISDMTSLGCATSGRSTNFQVDVGHTYYLRVDSLGQPGVFQLNLEQIFPPANDRFADAEAINSLPFSASVDNTNATTELGETVGCSSPFRSVWYSFTPAENMALRVDMAGSQVFGTVEIFLASGPAISDLTSLSCATIGLPTNFQAEAGQIYYLRVDSSGQPGILQVNLQQVISPANDNFVDAEAINSLPFSASVDNTNATVEFGEPLGCSMFRFRSVWYSFSPAENMALQVDMTGSQVGGTVSVFLASGPAISDLNSVACVSSGGSTNFAVAAGQTYYLRVDSFGQPGILQVNLQQITPPANDSFADAEGIGSLPFSAMVDNTNATTEFGEPQGCNFPSRSVWYSFSPAENMALQVDMTGSITSGNVEIFLATGPSLSDLNLLACVFSGGSTNFQVDAGETYYLRVDGQAGVHQLNLEQITPPANDRFVDAEPIGSLPFSATVDNTNATTEFGEPQGCSFAFRTVWYSFTPTENMAVRVTSPSGGSVNIFLASKPALSDLTSTACVFGNSSNLQVEAGQVYYLRVDSFFQPGVLLFSLEQIFPPANDNFTNAEVIGSLPFNATVDNTDATTEPGELFGCALNRSLWYSFTPAENMAVRVSSPSGGSVNIFLASGPSLSDLSFLACASSGNSTNLQAEAGKTYFLRVDSFGQPGVLQLSLEQIFPPANDNFADAETISSLPFNVTVDNTDATAEPGEPTGCSMFASRTVWYTFTPAENMALRVNAAGSVSVFLAVGPEISDLNLLTCAGNTATVFQVEAGKTYYLRLDSFGQGGVLQLNLAQLNPPANDNFANAELIDSVPFNASVDLTDASAEPNEPQFCHFMSNTIWYSFTPTETSVLRANTFGSLINGNVNIYKSTGTGFSGLQFLACSGPNTSPSFTAEAGQTYYLQAGPAFGETSGRVNVNLVPTNPPPNDSFTAATAVTSLPFSATVDITDATNEPGEPQFCNFMPNTVWYSFTSTETIKVRADTQGSTINGNVNIYHATGNGFPDIQFMQCTFFGGSTAFLAEAGETYYLQVGGSGQPGSIQFNLAEMPTISGRVTDAVTGTPLPGNIDPFARVTLQRACGEGCWDFVNSQYADGEGRFILDSYYYGVPLPAGTYRIEAAANLYQTRIFETFEFSGSNVDVGDLALTPPASIRGRAVDADTGTALPGASVTLYRCFDNGCIEFVNSQNTDGNGQFHFNSYYFGAPLPGGTYRLTFSDILHETTPIDITIGAGEDHDMGDVALTPLPLIGSISGKLVDKVTGQPVSQIFGPSLALYRCTDGYCEQFVNWLVPDSLGRFQFNSDYSGNPIPTGTFQIRAYADQYQEYLGDPFPVGEAENKNVGNIGLTSFPVRFSEMTPCAQIPASGGDCIFSIKITNGTSKDLGGKTWSMANTSLPESFAGYTNFQTKDPQDLDLGKGKSKVFRFQFSVPANPGPYGTYICTRVFVGEGGQAFLNTIGFRDLFCVLRNAGGFAIVSPQEVTSSIPTPTTAATTGTEIEPNNSCQTAQDVGADSYPFVMDGNLDSSQAPDIDFFRFTGTPGQTMLIDLEGQSTGKGTLADPFLGLFDSNCNFITLNDDSGSLNSHLEISVPDDGIFVLAATVCCDYGFFGGGNGSYQLTVAPIQYLNSIRGVVTDAVTGKALSGVVAPYAYIRLLQCGMFGCFDVNSQAAGSDGSFHFETDFNGNALRVGNYMIVASADQYYVSQTEIFGVGDGENYSTGKVALNSYPIRFSDLQVCAVQSDGGLCDFSVKITNGLATKFSGKAWSVIDGYNIGSFTKFTNFQADSPSDISLAPGKSAVLRFRFQVRGLVADGAVICATAFVGKNPSPFFNTSGVRFLFCFVKGSNGFSLMSEQEMHKQLQHMKTLEVEPKKAPSLKK